MGRCVGGIEKGGFSFDRRIWKSWATGKILQFSIRIGEVISIDRDGALIPQCDKITLLIFFIKYTYLK